MNQDRLNDEELDEATLDEQLVTALNKVYDTIASSQRELEPNAKRILYANMRKLYLR